jgi:RNA polymerase-binding transcription factor DksA
MNTANFKAKLEKELRLLESELKTVGQINPANPGDWQPTQDDLNVTNADKNELADQLENYEGNTAILKQLEIQLNDVKLALKKIEDGSYGICEVGGEAIPEDRLEAIPSARTCIEHVGK